MKYKSFNRLFAPLIIDSRVNFCNIALEEYQLLNNNKEQYLEKVFQRNVFSSKEIDINKDTIFEQSAKN